MPTALSQAWTQYRADLPTHIPQAAAMSFAGSFAFTFLVGVASASSSAVVLPFALASGTFSMVASLIDSGIRPLISLLKMGRVDGSERFFDWAGRMVIVLYLTEKVLPRSVIWTVMPLPWRFLKTWLVLVSLLNVAWLCFRSEKIFGSKEARLYLI